MRGALALLPSPSNPLPLDANDCWKKAGLCSLPIAIAACWLAVIAGRLRKAPGSALSPRPGIALVDEKPECRSAMESGRVEDGRGDAASVGNPLGMPQLGLKWPDGMPLWSSVGCCSSWKCTLGLKLAEC